jgi:hypothetical protein
MTAPGTAGAAAEFSKAEAGGAPAIARAETASAKPKTADFAAFMRVYLFLTDFLLGDQF